MRELPFILACGFAILMLTLSSPWHIRNKNTGSLLYIFWSFTGNLIYFVDAIVWSENIRNPAPVWCDIGQCLLLSFIYFLYFWIVLLYFICFYLGAVWGPALLYAQRLNLLITRPLHFTSPPLISLYTLSTAPFIIPTPIGANFYLFHSCSDKTVDWPHRRPPRRFPLYPKTTSQHFAREIGFCERK
jgi:hypothetical protein